MVKSNVFLDIDIVQEMRLIQVIMHAQDVKKLLRSFIAISKNNFVSKMYAIGLEFQIDARIVSLL